MVAMLQSRWKDVVDKCTQVLAIDDGNVKALYRRGKAHNMCDDWAEAKADLQRCLEIDAANAEAAEELRALNDKVTAHHKKEKALFGKMFS